MTTQQLKMVVSSVELNQNLLGLILEAYRPVMMDNTIVAIERAIENSKSVVEVINMDIEQQRLDNLF